MVEHDHGRILFSSEGVMVSYQSYPYEEPYWIRIKADKEYGKDSKNIYHLTPRTGQHDNVETYIYDWPQSRLINSNAVIIKRNCHPFVITSLLKESACITVCSDRWVGLLNVGREQIVSKPTLIHKFFANWPDQRMASTNVWIGPSFTENRIKENTVWEDGFDLRHEIKAQMTEITKSRAICRVHATLLPEYLLGDTTDSIKSRCSATLIVEPLPTRP